MSSATKATKIDMATMYLERGRIARSSDEILLGFFLEEIFVPKKEVVVYGVIQQVLIEVAAVNSFIEPLLSPFATLVNPRLRSTRVFRAHMSFPTKSETDRPTSDVMFFVSYCMCRGSQLDLQLYTLYTFPNS